ncbi:MAG: carbohydrate ABC transporter permease [Firmicutes bacterium]|nr:carbohydrate ABC transporter permease [Bacillota bacterium]
MTRGENMNDRVTITTGGYSINPGQVSVRAGLNKQQGRNGQQERNSARRRKIASTLSSVTATYLLLAVILVPFIWLIFTSFKFPVEFLSWPPTFLPRSLTIENYRRVLHQPLLLNYFANTFIVASASTLLALAVGSAAAYSLTNVKFPARLNAIFAVWVLITRMYPAIATAVPYFMLIKNLGLLDHRLALIITYTSFNLPLVIWFMLGFFQGLPEEINNAAIVDGCSLWQRFFKIGLPLAAPGLVTSAILSFILGWNEFLFAVILTSIKAKTVPVVVAGFITDKGLEWGEMSALGSMLVIPVIILAWLAQKYLIQGLTFGALKE